METFIKEFFYSDVCEYNHFKMPSREKAKAEREGSALLEKIKEHMTSEDLELLEKYKDCCGTVNSEDEYYAFICGARMVLKVLAEIFCQ